MLAACPGTAVFHPTEATNHVVMIPFPLVKGEMDCLPRNAAGSVRALATGEKGALSLPTGGPLHAGITCLKSPILSTSGALRMGAVAFNC